MSEENLVLKMLQKINQTLEELKADVNTLKADASEIKTDVKALDVRVENIEENMEHVKQHMVGKDEFIAALSILKDVHNIVAHTTEHQMITQAKVKKLESGR